MKNTDTHTSNPFSTGSGGNNFEEHIQALFVLLMLSRGRAPALPWQISEIQLQSAIDGYNIDDMLVITKSADGTAEKKMLAEIKHTINITEADKTFRKVICSAWNDFNNQENFFKERDVIALITGPLTAVDVNDTRMIFEWARYAKNSDQFFKKFEIHSYSNEGKRNKLKAFREQLKVANGDNYVADEMLYEFLKHFHFFGYDLDTPTGSSTSLVHTIISLFKQDPISIWGMIVNAIAYANQNAGVITLDSLPEDLVKIFETCSAKGNRKIHPSTVSAFKPEEGKQASTIALSNLVGAWDANNATDRNVIQSLTHENFPKWIAKMQEILLVPESPISLHNNKWRIKNRKKVWELAGAQIFDNHLDAFQKYVTTVLSERDPQFQMPVDKRFMANIDGKVFRHSLELRKGMAESLALMGNNPKLLTSCSDFKSEKVVTMVVRSLFENADWVTLVSLNGLLPVIAEAKPDQFLKSIESVLEQSPEIFVEIFAQESSNFFGQNCMTGLLWSLETLAWEEEYLVRSCVVLGKLASLDPGGNSANRPANSLWTILVPWLPQTTAPIEKRNAVLTTLQKKVPSVAWSLALGLLPGMHQSSMGTHKPSWRKVVIDDQPKGISINERHSQQEFHSTIVVDMAQGDMEKLHKLVEHIDRLSVSSREKLLAHLVSDEIANKPTDERLELWKKLTYFVKKHRRFPDAAWALHPSIVTKIASVADKLTPVDPFYQRLEMFRISEINLFDQRSREEIDEHRCQIVREILKDGGIDAVLHFAKSVEAPGRVGYALGANANETIDAHILPALLDNTNDAFALVASLYVKSRFDQLSWSWADNLDKSDWSNSQIARFLHCLPFSNETWSRVKNLLGDAEKEYWIRGAGFLTDTRSDISFAIDKLLEHGQNYSAIAILCHLLHTTQILDGKRSVQALLASANSDEILPEEAVLDVEFLIKALQDDPKTNINDLGNVEMAYLPLLGSPGRLPLKAISQKMAMHPDFFCQMLNLAFRSKKDNSPKKVLSEKEQKVAERAYKILQEWMTPPGLQPDGSFVVQKFQQWFSDVETATTESGRSAVAHLKIGQVLFHCPEDPNGLWIPESVAEILDRADANDMRRGFTTRAYNSRGVYSVSDSGEEQALVAAWEEKANAVENIGYSRFATALRDLVQSFRDDTTHMRSLLRDNLP